MLMLQLKVKDAKSDSAPEVMELINEIRKQPENLFEVIQTNVKKSVGQYLYQLTETDLTGFIGRDPYEREKAGTISEKVLNNRKFPMKGIGEVSVRVPQYKSGEFSRKTLLHLLKKSSSLCVFLA